MSSEQLVALQEAHAFDPFPVREDLGIYHVPFGRLVGTNHPEETLLDACRRFERVAIVGDSGSGKSSLTASVLGPLAEGVAPVLFGRVLPALPELRCSLDVSPCMATTRQPSHDAERRTGRHRADASPYRP